MLFMLVGIGVRTWIAWRNNVEAMSNELSLVDKVFDRALDKAIWDLDHAELERDVEILSQVKAVGFVELKVLRTGRSAEVLGRGRAHAGGTTAAPTLHQTLSFEPYPGATQALGELTLAGDDQVLWTQLESELASIVVTQLIQSALLAGVIMAIFNRMVTVHVRRVANHLASLTPQTLATRLRLDRRSQRRDELTMLVSGVDDLQSNLLEYLVKQRQAEQDLAAHRDRLEELVQEQTSELRAANARLEELVRIDPLTGLANRRHFDEVKQTEFRRAQRLGHPLSVLLCDIDFFKRFNDTYGHAEGDRCLAQVAETFRRAFARAGELPARIGGEEFAILLPETDLDAAVAAGRRLQALLDQVAIPHVDSKVSTHVTLSIGAAQLDAGMDNVDALLRGADLALYRAKDEGRNRVAA